MARLGIRPCDISRRLKVTHGCISKLLSKYQKTGSINPGGGSIGRPRVITPRVEETIGQYRREQPGIFSWELRDCLLRENVCSRENLPSLSSISRLIKHKMIADSTACLMSSHDTAQSQNRALILEDNMQSRSDLNGKGTNY